MQNILKVIFLSAFSLFLYFGVYAQTPSTEGKEFWVTLTVADAPSGTSNLEPYIAVSSKNVACQVTITNPNTGWTTTRNVPANSWTEVKDIPLAQWYPSDKGTAAAEKKYQAGLLITSTANVSVFAASRMEYSFDAANILPAAALRSEYIIQDYPPYNSEGESRTDFVVLATEDNTIIDITPSAQTYGGKPANTSFSITLNKGEVYHVFGPDQVTMSGSHVVARNDKKIAVFNGDVFTQVPGGKSARDVLYEQAMPVDYWGTEFIVTRSLHRDANRVRITAQNDATAISVDGIQITTINAYETYEIELSANTWTSNILNAITKAGRTLPDYIYTDYAHYIKTSCPCAVYSYDVSSAYALDDTDATTEQQYNNDSKALGDPSMVWISPIEQRIKEITFGVMGTDKTTAHYVNVVTETSNVASMQLLNAAGTNLMSASDFQVVPNQPVFSYARKQVATTISGQPNPVFTLKGDDGFVAHVYGHGYNESYAYSVGSATVQKSIKIDGDNLVSGNTYPNSFCVGDTLNIETNFGNYTVDEVYWDMGDGVTKEGISSFQYVYDNPGLYDMEALTKTTNPCTGVSFYDTIRVIFKVTTPELITRTKYICEGESFSFGNSVYTTTGEYVYEYNCDSIVTLNLFVGEATASTVELTAYDSLLWNGTMYYQSGSYEYHTLNAGGCDSTVTLNLQILTCLEMEVDTVLQGVICGDDDLFTIPYVKIKGDIAKAVLQLGKVKQELTFTDSEFIVLLDGITPNQYEAVLTVRDDVCERDLTFPVKLTVRYPNTIFAQKWDDVFAVYNKDYNGGYTFTTFQWYKNSEPIAGATGSYLYLGDQSFDVNDEYAVELTRKDGVTLMSCPKNPVVKTSIQAVTVNPTYVFAGETVTVNTNQNGQVRFVDMMGLENRKEPIASGVSFVSAPLKKGFYLLHVTLSDGIQQTFRIMVK